MWSIYMFHCYLISSSFTYCRRPFNLNAQMTSIIILWYLLFFSIDWWFKYGDIRPKDGTHVFDAKYRYVFVV